MDNQLQKDMWNGRAGPAGLGITRCWKSCCQSRAINVWRYLTPASAQVFEWAVAAVIRRPTGPPGSTHPAPLQGLIFRPHVGAG